jgi:hypothetical protein
MAQGHAILRFIGGKANLNGSTDQEKAMSEMLVDEEVDLFNLINKANYAPEKAQAYTDLFAEGGAFKTQLAFLEKLHAGDGPFFINGPKRCTGGYAVACTLDLACTLEPGLLAGFPKLTMFYNAMLALPEFESYKALPMYFSRT